jgi:hypothetical protein
MKKFDRVARKATTNTWPAAKVIRSFVAVVVVGNPLKTKAVTEDQNEQGRCGGAGAFCCVVMTCRNEGSRTRRHRFFVA